MEHILDVCCIPIKYCLISTGCSSSGATLMALNENDCLMGGCGHPPEVHHLVTDDLYRCNICKHVHVYTPYKRPDIKFEDVLSKMEELYK